MAAVLGPTVGGALVDAGGWRTIFLINVPLGVIIIYGAMTRLPRDSPGERKLPDPIGTLLLTIGTGSVVVGLSQGSEWGWTSGSVWHCIAGGVLGVGVGLMRSARHPAPAMELDLWRNRTFAVANAAAAVFGVSAFAFTLNGPLFLTTTWNYSVLEAGLALTPGAFAAGVGSVVAGKQATTPKGRLAAAAGGSLLVAAASLSMWAQLGTEQRYLEVFLPANLAGGVGFGAAFTALFGAGATSIPPLRFASGSGVLTMARQLGGVIGVALTAAILGAPGSAAVDPFLAVYLFCAGTAAAAGAVSTALL
jgi:hypothetical protein